MVVLHDEGKYLASKPLVLAGPQVHPAIDLPPSLLPTSLVLPVCKGVSEIAFAVSLVLPRKVAGLPTTVITPLASAVTLATY